MKQKLIAGLMALSLLMAGCSGGKDNSPSSGQSSSGPSASSSGAASAGSSQEDGAIDWDAIVLKQFLDPEPGTEIATIKTTMGDIKVMFFPDEAPLAVENFITHAKEGYYDNVIFHRVINGFMIQSGDPDGTGMGGESIWGKPFKNEPSLNLWHFRGALAMARTSQPDTNGSQFYIVQNPTVSDEMVDQMKAAGWGDKIIKKYQEVGGTPQLDQAYTVFGMVIDGMDVVDKIAALDTDANDKPTTDVVIQSITFEPVPDAADGSSSSK